MDHGSAVSALSARAQRRHPFLFSDDNIEPDVDWNISTKLSCSGFYSYLPTTEISVSVETCYFGQEGNCVRADRMIATCRALARALLRYDERYRN